MAFFVMFIMMVVSFVLSELLAPKPKTEQAKPADLGDFNFPTAEEGRVIPVVYGTVKLSAPNVIWYGNLKQVAVTKKVKTGLFSSKRITTGFKYYVGIQFGLCLGEVDELLQIWAGEKLLWGDGETTPGNISLDEANLFGGEEFGTGGIAGTLEFHNGQFPQTASSYLSDFQSQGGDTPGYPGICYCVFRQGYIGTSPSIQKWEFEVRRIPTQLSSSYSLVNSRDANPIHVAYEVMTEYLGFPSVNINTSNFLSAAQTLSSEGNGFSITIDSQKEGLEILQLIEDQIDGTFYLNPSTGQWEVNLIRGGYDIDTVPQIDDDNTQEVKEFTRGGWSDTVNEVRVEFANADDDYKRTYALAQDPANIRIQANRVVSTTSRYPGAKVGDLANDIAWRELRAKSYPLAKASIVVNREFWDLVPGDVLAFSNTQHGLTKLPMRVQKADRGTLEAGAIVLDLIQDVFTHTDPSYGAPGATKWEEPTQTLGAFPSDEQVVFEAPLAFVNRDPDSIGSNRVWCGARSQGNGETLFEIRQRSSAGAPGGSYYDGGSVYAFILIGELLADLAQDDHGGNFDIDADPDSLTEILEAIQSTDKTTAGADLTNLIMINDEFMIPLSAADVSGDARMYSVYRGVLDSVVSSHSQGDKVYLLSAGGGLCDVSYPDNYYVHIKLVPKSVFDELNEGSAINVPIDLNYRELRPYPPTEYKVNAADYPTTTSLEASYTGTGDDLGIHLSYIRRDFRTFNEVQGAETDAATLSSDFPTVNSTEYRLRVYNDPDGANTLFLTLDWNSGDYEFDVFRNKILKELAGVLPTRLRFRLYTRHVVDSTTYEALEYWEFDFDVTTELTGDHNFGAMTYSAASANDWTAPDTGTYAFSLNRAMAGDIRARLNGGSWTDVILSGNTSGNLTGVTANDVIEIIHWDNSYDDENFMLKVASPTSDEDAYAILSRETS